MSNPPKRSATAAAWRSTAASSPTSPSRRSGALPARFARESPGDPRRRGPRSRFRAPSLAKSRTAGEPDTRTPRPSPPRPSQSSRPATLRSSLPPASLDCNAPPSPAGPPSPRLDETTCVRAATALNRPPEWNESSFQLACRFCCKPNLSHKSPSDRRALRGRRGHGVNGSDPPALCLPWQWIVGRNRGWRSRKRTMKAASHV